METEIIDYTGIGVLKCDECDTTTEDHHDDLLKIPDGKEKV